MRLDGEMIGEVFVLLILCALVGAILYMLTRFWGQCNADTEHAKERVVWPTTTVQATLYDAYVYSHRNHSSVKGKYKYEFGGSEFTTELYEGIGGTSSEKDNAARALKAEGKTVDLKVQYNPEDSTEVSDQIVTTIPNRRPWIAGFLVVFTVVEALILRGLYRSALGIFR